MRVSPKLSPLSPPKKERRARRTKTCPSLEVEAAAARQELEEPSPPEAFVRRRQRTKTCPSHALQNIAEDREATTESIRLESQEKVQALRPSNPTSPRTSESGSLPEAYASAVQTPSTTASLPGMPNIKSWRCGSTIGQGSYGTVCRALDTENGFIFCVKKSVVTEDDEEGQKYIQKLREELDILRSLRHPNIICCYGHEYCSDTLYIFMEFAEGGSLATMLKEFGALDGLLLRNTVLGMLQGLAYLHTRSPVVVHRDIKSANVLLDLDFNVKLADFGCSKRCQEDLTTTFRATGSLLWMAPEVVLGTTGFGRKADIWSFGCTVLEAMTAEPPWGKGAIDGAPAAMRKIGYSTDTPPIPEGTSSGLLALLQSCLQRSADLRPTATELLSCEYFMPPVKDRRRHHESRVAWT